MLKRMCTNCKHFLVHPEFREYMQLGWCKKNAKISLVDGTYTYRNVDISRKYVCKGIWWEEKEYKEEKEDLGC